MISVAVKGVAPLPIVTQYRDPGVDIVHKAVSLASKAVSQPSTRAKITANELSKSMGSVESLVLIILRLLQLAMQLKSNNKTTSRHIGTVMTLGA